MAGTCSNNGFAPTAIPMCTFEVTVSQHGRAPITLPSGALLIVNANGTFDYDPNHKFDYLPRPTRALPT